MGSPVFEEFWFGYAWKVPPKKFESGKRAAGLIDERSGEFVLLRAETAAIFVSISTLLSQYEESVFLFLPLLAACSKFNRNLFL